MGHGGRLGHSGTKIVWESGQEKSVVALKKTVGIKWQSETVMMESPIRDSRANGSAERESDQNLSGAGPQVET